MPKAVILFDTEGVDELYKLSLDYPTSIIHKEYYEHLSPMLIYKSVERARLYKEQPTEYLVNFMFPEWVGKVQNCILNYKDIPVDVQERYKHVYKQPTEEWVLVGHTYNNNGRWYTKSTPRSLLK